MEASTPPPTQPPITAPDPVAKSNRIAMFIILALIAIVAVVLAFVLLGGESKEEKALANVCAARADIQSRVDKLVTTDFADFTLSGFKSELAGIQADIKTIQANEADLGIDRKQQIQDATRQFGTTIKATTGSLLTTKSLNDAEATLQAAASDLATGYRAAFTPVDCTGVDIE